jgi:hypothetical protein
VEPLHAHATAQHLSVFSSSFLSPEFAGDDAVLHPSNQLILSHVAQLVDKHHGSPVVMAYKVKKLAERELPKIDRSLSPRRQCSKCPIWKSGTGRLRAPLENPGRLVDVCGSIRIRGAPGAGNIQRIRKKKIIILRST